MDFDALTAPLEGPSPCGEDLSFSPAFDQIADMRREDDPTLNQGEWITALKAADWPGVSRLIVQSVSQRDYPVVIAGVLVTSLVFVIVNLIVDLLNAVEAMTPPARSSGEESFDMVVPAMLVAEFPFTEVTLF
mgnify:CR=1 FL=1